MEEEKRQANYFGFEQVNPKDKASKVGQVFSSVAKSYDIMNDLMSMGVHRLWKKEFVAELTDPYGKLLDVAGGSGDISLKFYEQSKQRADITISDINPDMLKQAQNRFIDMNLLNKFKFVCANGEELPFQDDEFDYYTIAFGIRNVTHISKLLSEAYRVLKPGGKFVCLEFSKVTNPHLAKLYELYSFNVIPKIGKLVAGDEASYQYLVESIKQFPDQESFKKLIQKAGFENVSYKNLSNGVVAIHIGWKL